MIRFGPRQEDQTSTSRSRHRWSRLVPMLALVGVVVLLSGCGSEVVQPYSHITPQTEKANDIQTLYKITFWAALIVFIGVQAAILYTALRFRRRNEDVPSRCTARASWRSPGRSSRPSSCSSSSSPTRK